MTAFALGFVALKPRGCVRGGVAVVQLILLAFAAAVGWVLDLGAEANQR